MFFCFIQTEPEEQSVSHDALLRAGWLVALTVIRSDAPLRPDAPEVNIR